MLETASATWERLGRPAAFLDHRGTRLADASELEKHSHYSSRLSDVDQQYLVACRKAEQGATRRTRWVRGSIYALLLSIIAGLIAWINQAYINDQVQWYATVRPYRVANFDPYVLSADAERTLKPGQSFRECANDCPEMVVVPAASMTSSRSYCSNSTAGASLCAGERQVQQRSRWRTRRCSEHGRG